MRKFSLACFAVLVSLAWPVPQPPDARAQPSAPPLAPPSSDVIARASHAFNEVARRGLPAVVSISTVKSAATEDDLLGQLFGSAPPDDSDPSDSIGGQSHPGRQSVSLGSGIIIREDGMILTNNHVVENAERITVSFDDKKKSRAHVVGTDPSTDLAVIQLDEHQTSLPTLAFGDSDALKVGDWAIAIGSPFGLNRSVSFGIISAKDRAQMGILDIEDFIQTDAAINPGSSGGPLLGTDGRIIGVNTAIFSQGSGFMGIGFAVPARIAREVSTELIKHGRVRRGWIGVAAQDLTADLGRFFRARAEKGALLSSVTPGSPAAVSGFEAGDVVLRYNESAVPDATAFKDLVGKTTPGTSVRVDFERAGTQGTKTISVTEQPLSPAARRAQAAGHVAHRTAPRPSLGISVHDLPAELARILHVSGGALVSGVHAGSPAYEAGIDVGDVVLRVDHHEIHSAHDFSSATRGRGGDELTVLYVQRGLEEKLFVPLRQEG
jgi:serine protease Do